MSPPNYSHAREALQQRLRDLRQHVQNSLQTVEVSQGSLLPPQPVRVLDATRTVLSAEEVTQPTQAERSAREAMGQTPSPTHSSSSGLSGSVMTSQDASAIIFHGSVSMK